MRSKMKQFACCLVMALERQRASWHRTCGAHAAKSARVWNVSSRARASRSNRTRTQPMVRLASTTVSKARSNVESCPLAAPNPRPRRPRLRLEEDTSSENLCRNGGRLSSRVSDVAIGSDLEIRIPLFSIWLAPAQPARLGAPANGNRFAGRQDQQSDFATPGPSRPRPAIPRPERKARRRQFTGPRFQRVFRSESAA